MKPTVWMLVCLIFLPSFLHAQKKPRSKTRVILLGMFHFNNPGVDVAKFQNANILTAERQQEVMELVNCLVAQKPEKIFVESTPKAQGVTDSLYGQFLQDKWTLPANEIYQVGFRVAKALNHPGVINVDYRQAGFPFDSLVRVLQANNQASLLQQLTATIDSIQRSFNESLANLTVSELLVKENSTATNQVSVGSYFRFFQAGDVTNHIGSYIGSEWWRRNMVIYENILKRLSGREKTILVMFGSAHTALLREFAKYNDDWELVDIGQMLGRCK